MSVSSSRSAEPHSAPLGASFTASAPRNNLNDSAGISWKLQLFVFVLAAAVVVSRRPDALFNPQFFGEDGPVWYGQAYAFGWLASLTHQYGGYLQTLPRLAASVALLVPLRFAPLVMNLIGITIQVLPVTVLLSSRCSNWASLSMRAFMAIVYIALPNTTELDVSITNAQWHLALIACMLVLASITRDFRWRIFDIAVFLLSGLTGPFCILLLPIATLFWWRRREPSRLIPVVILAATSVVQVVTILQASAANRPKVGLGATPELFIRLLAGQVYLGALLGQHSLPANKNIFFLAVVAVLGTAILVYCFIKTKLELKLLILFAELILATSLLRPMMSMTVPQWEVLKQSLGIRYWFFPMLAFAWALIWCAGTSKTKPVRIAAWFGLVCMLIGILHDWEYTPYPSFHFQQRAQEFAHVAPGSFMSIAIYPPGWTLDITKRNPACDSMPVGHIEQPAQNARVSGAIGVSGWVSGMHPIRQISVYVDHSLMQSTIPNLKRPDIDQSYLRSPIKDKGWATTIDLSKIAPGHHEIVARAFGKGACEADIAATSIERTP